MANQPAFLNGALLLDKKITSFLFKNRRTKEAPSTKNITRISTQINISITLCFQCKPPP
jgi:hypothetical protein